MGWVLTEVWIWSSSRLSGPEDILVKVFHYRKINNTQLQEEHMTDILAETSGGVDRVFLILSVCLL